MIVLVYLGIVLPYLVGQAWLRILGTTKENNGVLISYTHGLIGIGGMFFLISLVPLQSQWTLIELASMSGIVSGVMGIISLIIANKHVLDGFFATMERLRAAEAGYWVCIGIAVLTIGLAVFVTVPSVDDATPELVGMMMDSGRLYGADPYTGVAYVDGRVNHTPIEAVYAVLSVLSGVDATILIQRILPMLLVPAYLAVGIMLLGVFLRDKTVRRRGFCIYVLLLVLGAARVSNLYTGVLLNPWNGATLITVLTLPFQFYFVCKWLQDAFMHWITVVLSMGVCVMAAQLVYTKAGLYSCVLWGLGLIIKVYMTHSKYRRAQV